MIEQVHNFSVSDDKAIEKVLFDENLNYIHLVLPKDEGLPEHNSNANVYLTVLRGTLSIGLEEQEIHDYGAGTLLKIPFDTKMNVRNLHNPALEIMIVKAPAPENRLKKEE